MPQLNALGVVVSYRDEGAGPTVILGHSSTASGGQWRSLSACLSTRCRVIAPDHVGYGRTAACPMGVSLMDAETAIIGALIEHAKERVHLVGHSYGGAILARTALRGPERVRSLTLIEPTFFHLLAPAGKTAAHQEIRAVADQVIRLVNAGASEEAACGFIDYWSGPGAYVALDERVRASVLAGMSKLCAEWATAFETGEATTEALARLDIPIQLIGGSNSTQAARAVIDVLCGVWPRAAHVEIAGAGHMSPVTHPQAVNQAIESFLQNHVERSIRQP